MATVETFMRGKAVSVHEKEFSEHNFILRYSLVSREILRDDPIFRLTYMIYGILLEKFDMTGNRLEGDMVYVSESEKTVKNMLKILYDHEVTPMSLSEIVESAHILSI
ncbi:MAG: DUF6514 family protein [Defluviitaleaceae bacterium]|nr:DUF6514 family protein [Defluviitaleaceae bacterium]